MIKKNLRKPQWKILITNDDGISSPGLKALTLAMKTIGDVWVVAPEKPQNAVGRAMTLHKPLRFTEFQKQTYSVNGTPADCITLALEKLLKAHPPDLIISGINKGLNLGDDVTNSGTVSGAMEGMLHGIASFAVSQDDQQNCRYKVAAGYALRLARMVLRYGLQKDTLLNMNVPNCPFQDISGVKFTSLSQRRYLNPVIEKVDPRGRHYYWIAGERVSWQRRKTSDFEAISKGMVSITPLHLDMTEYGVLKALRHWEKSLMITGKGLSLTAEYPTEKDQKRKGIKSRMGPPRKAEPIFRKRS